VAFVHSFQIVAYNVHRAMYVKAEIVIFLFSNLSSLRFHLHALVHDRSAVLRVGGPGNVMLLQAVSGQVPLSRN